MIRVDCGVSAGSGIATRTLRDVRAGRWFGSEILVIGGPPAGHRLPRFRWLVPGGPRGVQAPAATAAPSRIRMPPVTACRRRCTAGLVANDRPRFTAHVKSTYQQVVTSAQMAPRARLDRNTGPSAVTNWGSSEIAKTPALGLPRLVASPAR